MPAKERFRGRKAAMELGFLPSSRLMSRRNWARLSGISWWSSGGISLRSGLSFVIGAMVLGAAASGAAAKNYPPPDYPPAPVPVYRDGPPVYRDARGVPIDPRYVQPAPGEEV